MKIKNVVYRYELIFQKYERYEMIFQRYKNIFQRYENIFQRYFTFNEKEKSWFAGSFEHSQLGHAVAEKGNFKNLGMVLEIQTVLCCRIFYGG